MEHRHESSPAECDPYPGPKRQPRQPKKRTVPVVRDGLTITIIVIVVVRKWERDKRIIEQVLVIEQYGRVQWVVVIVIIVATTGTEQ